jgi:very-short-patch-repair endonuclease
MPIARQPHLHGGLVATHELHAAGFDRAAIAAAVSARLIRRVRQGWYSANDLAPVLARTARVGGLATCATSLSAAGLWVLPDARLHVAVAPNACQLRSPADSRVRLREGDVVTHWTLAPGEGRLVRALPESLLDYASCAAPELVAATANSMLRDRPMTRVDWPRLRMRFPHRLHSALELVDGICESGSEFVFWYRLPKRRSGMRRQVWIPGVGRVDFLIGERLVVEIDGFTYHGARADFDADRDRDAALSIVGYRSLRFSHRQVFEHWPTVEAAVSAAIARGDHL